MRGTLPGSDHTTTIHRQEAVIIYGIGSTPGITKVEPLRCQRTGSSKKLLRLEHDSSRQGMLQAWLYLGPMKRLLLIGIHHLATVQSIHEALRYTLRRFKVEVHIRLI